MTVPLDATIDVQVKTIGGEQISSFRFSSGATLSDLDESVCELSPGFVVKLGLGDLVLAAVEFNTSNTGSVDSHTISKETRGVVVQTNDHGDAEIKWPNIDKRQPLMPGSWDNVEVYRTGIALNPADRVMATVEFNTGDTGSVDSHTISKGTQGVVVQTNNHGAAEIKWPNIDKRQPLMPGSWDNVEVYRKGIALSPADRVMATVEFNTSDTGSVDYHMIPKGTQGVVVQTNSHGDAEIKWPNIDQRQPLMPGSWDNIDVVYQKGIALNPADRVMATVEFNTGVTGSVDSHTISKGTRGVVVQTNSNGDAEIKWPNIDKRQPLMPGSWDNVEVYRKGIALSPGDRVMATVEFNTSDTGSVDSHVIPKGNHGIAVQRNSNGDVEIKWPHIGKRQPLMPGCWNNVEVYQKTRKLCVGDLVVAAVDFNTYLTGGSEEHTISKGMQAVVVKILHDGSVGLSWEGISSIQVMSCLDSWLWDNLKHKTKRSYTLALGETLLPMHEGTTLLSDCGIQDGATLLLVRRSQVGPCGWRCA